MTRASAFTSLILCVLLTGRGVVAWSQEKPKKPPQALGDLLKQAEEQGPLKTVDPLRYAPPQVNEALCQARKIRKLESQHLTLYTDLPEHPAIDELPQVFDLAVPQWAAYFDVPPASVKKWRMVATLAREKERFYGTGLWPESLPPFLHGFMAEGQCWCYEQPSEYYRRHLLLHEGTHGFMQAVWGGLGPPWYAEGIAELLGTHTWDGKQLALGVIPQSRESTPLWGRIKIIKDAIAADAKRRGENAAGEGKQVLSLLEIMDYSNKAHLQTEAYAWSWAAAVMCDRHPDLRKAFRGMRSSLHLNTQEFSLQFWNKTPGANVATIARQWEAFLATLDYGYDFERELLVTQKASDLPADEVEITLEANRGWQASGYRLQFNETYQLTATGRFQIAKTSKPWISEPEGITLRYHQGQPLGKLLAVVSGQYSPDSFFKPRAIGAGNQIQIPAPHLSLAEQAAGELYLRVNDFPAELKDNEGKITVKIKKSTKK